jgi:hypothetical protein
LMERGTFKIFAVFSVIFLAFPRFFFVKILWDQKIFKHELLKKCKKAFLLWNKTRFKQIFEGWKLRMPQLPIRNTFSTGKIFWHVSIQNSSWRSLWELHRRRYLTWINVGCEYWWEL